MEFGLKDKAASRAGGGGGGGDYEAGLSGRANGGEWQLQVQELEERTRRAAARESGSAPAAAFVTTGHSVAAAPDDYPALAPAPGGGGGASGWAGAPRGGQGRGRGAEDFPTLGGGGGGGRGGEGRAVQAYGPGTSRAQQQESPLGVTLGALAGKQSKLREQEQRKAAAKQAAAQAAAEAAALKQSFRQAVVPNEGGPLAVRIHRGEVPSNHGAAPPPAPAAVATHVQQAPKAKVVTLGAARARNSIATAASKASGGGGWGSALGSMGVQSSSRSGISGVIRHAPAPAPAPAQLMHSSHSSSGSLDRLADGADKPAPPLQGLDLGSMYFKGAAGPPPGLQAGAGDDEDWEPYDPTAFAPQGGGQEDAFPGLPAPPPPSSSLAGAKSGGTAPSGSAFVRALAQQPKPTPQGQGQGQGQPKKSLGTKGTKKKAQALQDLAFLR